MARVSLQSELGVPADVVWEMVGKFNAIGQWHPMVERSQTEGNGTGATRKLKLLGGGAIVERLEHVSNMERLYLYSVVDSPFPVSNWVAEVRVCDRSDGTSTVEWSSNFTPIGADEIDAVKAIQGVFQAGLDNLKRIYGG